MWGRVWAIEPVVVGFCGSSEGREGGEVGREITGNRWRHNPAIINHFMSEEINQEILKEIRKSRRSNQIFLAVIAIAFLVGSLAHKKPFENDHSWTTVQTAVKQMDYPRALTMAQANVARYPSDYYGHSYLGYIYLAIGDTTNSEAEYLKAYQLFPSEENEKNLAAVRKRLTTGEFKLLSK